MEIKELETLGEIYLNDTNKVKVILKDVNGKNYLDVRKYYLSKQEEYKATNKGIMLSESKWRELLPLLQELLSE